MSDLTTHARTIAIHYWGEPNSRLSSATELRWGTNGSKKMDLKQGVWFDHEHQTGGGVVDLVRSEEKPGTDVSTTLATKFGIEAEQQDTLKPGRGYVIANYDYYDADGVLRYQVQRWNPKNFTQRSPNGDGWLKGLNGAAPLPYNLPNLLRHPDHAIYIVEGEKDADALIEQGYLATTNSGGAGNWKPDLNPYFQGRDVYLIPDNHDTGLRHMHKVADALKDTARSMHLVKLPNLPAKGDVFDWIANGHFTHDTFAAEVAKAQRLDPANLIAPAEVNSPGAPEVMPFPTYDETALLTLPPLKWMVADYLTSNGFGVVYGPPGAGKSFLAIDIAMSIANGKPWQGNPVVQGSVLYISGEGFGGMGKRIKAWRAHHQAEVGSDFVVLPEAVRLLDDGDMQRLYLTVAELKRSFSLIILDTVARMSTGGEENSATDMGLFISAADGLRKHFNCAVLAVHHANKHGKGGIDAMRGSSALAGAADTVLAVRQNEGHIELAMEKQKDAEAAPKKMFTLHRVKSDMGVDTSAVLVETEGNMSDSGAMLTDNEVEALMILERLEAAADGGNVEVKAWVDAHGEAVPNKSYRTRSTARQRLLDKGAVVKTMRWVKTAKEEGPGE